MIPARICPKRLPRGNALLPVLLILVALAISGLVFFFVTRPKMEAARAAQEAAAQPAPATAPAPAPEPPKAAPPKEAPPAPATAAAPPPAAPAMSGPEEVAKEFAFLLSKNDLASAAKELAGDDAGQTEAVQSLLHKIFRELGYKPSAPSQPQIIGMDGAVLRLAVPLAKPGAPNTRLMLDLERDATGAWKVSKIHLPADLEAALASLPPSSSPAVPSSPMIVVDHTPDALVQASDFIDALLKQDMQSARKLIDTEKVSPVKLAALCIVFEDGKYRLADTRPIVATVSSETSSWVIARVRSDTLQQNTEFGLEMEKIAPGWRISGVNLSKLLSDSARPSTIEGVPYTPLVQNPKGGDSIALYFEYDQAKLHPRAEKQLDIIASLLKASPNKKLTIGGYTDALGSDQYNIALSQHRAGAVREYLLSHGVPASQVSTAAFGKALPLKPNVNPDGTDNPEGRSHNRRAEIFLDF